MIRAIDPISRATPEKWLQDRDIGLLLQSATGPDAEMAFSELVKRNTPRIRGFFRRHLSDRSAVEDLTQEVFLRLYRSRERYRPSAGFATWIFLIARNVLRNYQRTCQRHPSVPLKEQDRIRDQFHDRQDAPMARLERAEQNALIRQAVASLGDRKRAAVELHQFDEQTYAQVGARLSMTPKAAKSLLHRARLDLRNRLQPLFS